MITQISYNVLIERFRAFAEGHFLIKGFTHGHPSNIDIEKGLQFPWMHVYPVEVEPRQGSRLYSFIVTFADLPRDKETPAEYEREVISDCIKLAEDLIAEIQNGLTLFGPTVELEGTPSIEVFIQEYSQTLTGVNLALTLSVPWDWSACDIPADWSVGGSGSGGTGSGGLGVILETNGVVNDEQTLLNLIDGENVTLEYLGNGRVRFNSTGGGGVWGAITGVLTNQTDLVLALAQKANVADLGAVAFSNDYNDLDNLPSIPAAQVPSDWNATTGVTRILNKPTIPAAQVNSDWSATSGVAEILNKPTIPAAQIQSDWNQANNAALDFIKNKPTIPAAQLPSDWNATTGVTRILNKPTIPAAQVNSDWNASSGLAEILNKPTIPTTLDSLTDVNAPSPTNGQVLTWNGTAWVNNTPASGGSVTSVALTMPAAFSVSGSPVTTAGTLAVVGAGTTVQYVRGDGTLATMPTGLPPTGAAGGDLMGTYPNPTVSHIHGIEMQAGTPTAGDVWLYEGSPAKWQHQKLPAVHVTNDSAVTGITVKDALNHLNTTKVESNAAITGATATKITFDSKGLVTGGTTLAASDMPTGIDAANIGAGTVSNTEFGYLDGVSSAIQTQLNGKQTTIGLTTVGNNLATLSDPNAITFLRVNADNTVTARTPAQVLTDLGIAGVIVLGKDMAGASAVNTTTNTVLFSVAIPANTLQANDFIELFTQISTTTPNGTAMNMRVYLNSANNLTGAVQLGIFTNTVGTGGSGFMRNFFVTAIGTSGNIRGFGQALNSSSHYNPTSVQATNTTINTTITQYILLAVQMGNATSTTSLQGSIIKLTR